MALVCARLGVWQLHRLDQRRAHNREAMARLAMAPVTLSSATVPMAYRRVRARGVFDGAHSVIEVFRSREGTPGVVVVSPLRLDDGSAVFVERGWVASADGRSLASRRWAGGDSVVVTGWVLPVGAPRRARGSGSPSPSSWPRYVRAVDPSVLQSDLPYPVVPFVVRANRVTPPDSNLWLWREPVFDDGPHLGYAMQWFAFATIALVGFGVFAYRSGRSDGVTAPTG